jgi:hypothetical protein
MSLRSAALVLAISLAAPAAAEVTDPMRFFEGRTESVGTVKLMMNKPYRTRAVGKGEIMPDGSLHLVQRVEDQGQQPRERRWRMRQVAPGHYTGTMTEARGPVTVDAVDGRYRFRFRMDGNVSVEQWLTPMPDGQSASSRITIRKYGILVGRSDAVIRKLN